MNVLGMTVSGVLFTMGAVASAFGNDPVTVTAGVVGMAVNGTAFVLNFLDLIGGDD
jgi:hypothetical protein